MIVRLVQDAAVVIISSSGLVDRVLALHAGSRGFDSHRGHMSERFSRSNRPGYQHPVSSELENSGIRVAVGACSVTERRRWRPPYQTGKTVHVHAKHYTHNEDGRTAPAVCGNGSVPLSHSGNVVTRIGIHTHTYCLEWKWVARLSALLLDVVKILFHPKIGIKSNFGPAYNLKHKSHY